MPSPTSKKPKLVPRKPGAQKPKNPAKAPEDVVPSADFTKKVSDIVNIAQKLVAHKKKTTNPKTLQKNDKYQAALADLGNRLGHVFSVIQGMQFQMNEALVRLRLVINSDSDQKNVKKATLLSQRLGSSLRAVNKLAAAVTKIKDSGTGLPVEHIETALRGAESITTNAMTIRADVVKLHQVVKPQLSGRKQIVLPKFHVVDGFTVIGDPASKEDKKTASKIAQAQQMGADDFPDPFTVMGVSYSEHSKLALSPRVRKAIRYSVLFSAAKKPMPKRPTLLDLYNGTGLDSAGHFNYDTLNVMFKAVLGNVMRKQATPECRDFVLAADPAITEADYGIAVDHVARKDARGKKVLDDVRVAYAHAVTQWFRTYLPVL
jgi:hypothetical protein